MFLQLERERQRVGWRQMPTPDSLLTSDEGRLYGIPTRHIFRLADRIFRRFLRNADAPMHADLPRPCGPLSDSVAATDLSAAASRNVSSDRA